MLKFLGTGSAFHTTLGNNAAYMKKGDSLILIDCGGMVFHQLRALKLLDNINHLYCILTHTHPDHAGSLGEVIFYAHYVRKIKPMILFPNREWMEGYLGYIGVTKEIVELKSEKTVSIEEQAFGKIEINFRETKHVPTMPAYGFIMKVDKTQFYYSGDSCLLPEEILEGFDKDEIQVIYQDTCGLDYEGNPHLYVGKLEQLIPVVQRGRVFCMHLDQHIEEKELLEKGFSVAKVEL